MTSKSKPREPADRLLAADEVEERIALALHELQRGEGRDHSIPGSAEQDYQQLWFALLRGSWRSLALVPADAGGSAKEIAAALAYVGQLLHEPVATLAPANSHAYVKAAEFLHQFGPP